MKTKSPLRALAATIVLITSFSGIASGQNFVDWDETTNILPTGTLSVPGTVTVNGNTINVSMQFNDGTAGSQMVGEVLDNATNFNYPSIFSPALPTASAVRGRLGWASSVDISFSSPVRNPSLYFNALGSNTLTFSDPFIVVGADAVPTFNLIGQTVTGINNDQLPLALIPNDGGSQEADFQIQFSGTFNSLSFTSSMTSQNLDQNTMTLSVVPEPASATLLGLSGALLALRRRRR